MILARAPYRISLGGGGTDLPSYYSEHGGFVLSAAINKYLYICVNRPSADDLIRLKYSTYEQVVSPDDIQHDLVRPALKLLKLDSSLEIVSMADVPAGTGLGSSGTYLVSLLAALYELNREKIPTQYLAEIASHIEIEMAGHPVGKQDHYLAAFGGFTCLDIQKDGNVNVTPLDISMTTLEEFRNRVLIFYTGITRASGDVLESQRKDTQSGDPIVLNSLHETKALGYQVKEALECGDLDEFGHLLDKHWSNKKMRAAAVTNPMIDNWYEIAMENGALGGKVMGAGGGGFFMFCCDVSRKSDIRQALAKAGLREMAYDFDFEGAKIVMNL